MTATLAKDPEADTASHDGFSAFNFARRKSLVVAVSGGGDSTALLLLLKSHLHTRLPGARLVAVTIDHRLRPDSAVEARAVAKFCAGIGIEHRTLEWRGEKPASGVSAAAREARYRLLAQAAREAGADIVVTGHTADDQAETVAMRRARGEGRGLAGMAPATLYENEIWIVRPLLDISRKALRTYLRERGIGWFDDPTNSNPAYERVRARAAGVDRETAPIKRAGEMRMALSRAAAGFIEQHAMTAAPGLLRLDRGFARVRRDAGVHSLRVLLAVSGGREHLPAEQRTGDLFDQLSGRPFRATLSRAVVDSRPAGIFIHRERRSLPVATPARNSMIWDGRFRVTIDDGDPPMLIGPLGRERSAAKDVSGFDAPDSLVRAALAAQPCLWVGGESDRDHACAPSDIVRFVPRVAPWTRFLPAFDLDVAVAVSTLLGAPMIPAPPFRGHKGAKA